MGRARGSTLALMIFAACAVLGAPAATMMRGDGASLGPDDPEAESALLVYPGESYYNLPRVASLGGRAVTSRRWCDGGAMVVRWWCEGKGLGRQGLGLGLGLGLRRECGRSARVHTSYIESKARCSGSHFGLSSILSKMRRASLARPPLPSARRSSM